VKKKGKGRVVKKRRSARGRRGRKGYANKKEVEFRRQGEEGGWIDGRR
jgi:hypothetical protein